MKALLKVVALVGLVAMSTAASAISVTNRDEKAHVLVFEDPDETITELTINAGETVDDLCHGGCFIWLKEVEDFQFVEKGGEGNFVIRDGRLVVVNQSD